MSSDAEMFADMYSSQAIKRHMMFRDMRVAHPPIAQTVAFDTTAADHHPTHFKVQKLDDGIAFQFSTGDDAVNELLTKAFTCLVEELPDASEEQIFDAFVELAERCGFQIITWRDKQSSSKSPVILKAYFEGIST